MSEREDLLHVKHHTIEEEWWRIEPLFDREAKLKEEIVVTYKIRQEHEYKLRADIIKLQSKIERAITLLSPYDSCHQAILKILSE